MAYWLWSVVALMLWSGPLLHGQKTAAGPAACPRDCCQVLCVTGGQLSGAKAIRVGPHRAAAGPVILVTEVAGEPGDEDQAGVEKEPSQWIGVRMTPIPEPLAAHIGKDGTMIANIVKGSPADQAGLERYDVITAFNGQKIGDMEDLVNAVGGVKAGRQAELKIVRGGETKTLNIAPAERPDPGHWEYKYEEPEANVVDRSLNLRGHRLRLGPGGDWIMEELGPLRAIPDVLKKLEKFEWKGFEPEDLDVRVEVAPFGALPKAYELDADAESGARVEVQVRVDKDGQVTTVRRDADGKIHVERVDPDGQKSSATYDEADEFKKADPEGYKLYRRFGGLRGRMWMQFQPDTEQLDKLRHKFEVEVKQKLEDASKVLDRGREAAREAHKRFESEVKKEAAAKEAETAARNLSIDIDADGGITITTSEGGRTTVRKFDSKEELQQKAPELYEKVKSMFK